MEQRFAHDFSRVRVHTDARAAASARALGASAYTVGSSVVFAEGRYSPAAGSGRSLLAHELAHTIQQSASPATASSGRLRVEPPGTSHERAAETAGSGATRSPRPTPTPGLGLQRQPAPEKKDEPESLFTIFVADEKYRRDRRFARRQAMIDAASIRKAGKLSRDDRHLVNAKLRFFEGEAWRVYGEVIRPALVEVTQEEIDMSAPAPAGTPSGGPSLQPGFGSEFLKRMQSEPTYIDNHIKEVNYFTAELAKIHYYDGGTYDLGLVPKYMQPPVVEVDCHTPLYDIHPVEDPKTKGVGFMLEAEMKTAPRTLPFSELLKKYVHPIDFVVISGGRVIPSRINELTAPTLCGVLRSSEAQYEENVKLGATIGYYGTVAMSGYVGAGGFGKGTGVTATKLLTGAAPRTLSNAGKKLWNEFNALLGRGGTKTIEVEGMKFVDVAVSEEGSKLAVSRWMSEVPAAARGQGTGARIVKDFEDAAAELGRMNGSKTVSIDVGVIINPGWREFLEARGYVMSKSTGHWIKEIPLVHL